MLQLLVLLSYFQLHTNFKNPSDENLLQAGTCDAKLETHQDEKSDAQMINVSLL